MLCWAVAILPLSEPTLWCLLGRIAKCVKVAFRYPLRVLPGEASHSGVLSQVGYPGFQGQTWKVCQEFNGIWSLQATKVAITVLEIWLVLLESLQRYTQVCPGHLLSSLQLAVQAHSAPSRKCCIWEGHIVLRLSLLWWGRQVCWRSCRLILGKMADTPITACYHCYSWHFSTGSLWKNCRMRQGGQTPSSWADENSVLPGFLGLSMKGMSGLQWGLSHLFCPIHLYFNFKFLVVVFWGA
jgi:hypothetical protein